MQLGDDFRVQPARVGNAGMVCVEHLPSGIELIVVPGGRFEMGLTARDREAIADVEPDWWITAWSSPARIVEVAPFLLSRTLLTTPQVVAIGGPRTDCLSSDDAAAFAKRSTLFRLPSEAELEYVGREGGVASFITTPENAWGFRNLTDAAWAADEWHDSYHGAPATSAAWNAGGPPGVYRGSLMEPPRNDREALYALAACRGRMREPEDEWPVALRVAMSIT